MRARLALDDLGGGRFDTVVVAGVDMQGRLFGKRMPVERFLERDGIHVCSCVLAWDWAQSPELVVEFAGFHTGWHDVKLVSDPATLRPAAWLERTAICMGTVVDDEHGEPVPVAPQNVLRRQVEALAELGLRAAVATELEFHLYRGDYDAARAARWRDLPPTTRLRADYAIAQGDELEPFFAEVRRVLADSAIPIELAQVEWGLGQWEINLVHGDPLEVAENHALFKLALRALAARHGLAATFMARPGGDVGSSCHVHLSLVRDGAPVFPDERAPDGMSDAMRHALGGLLEHLDDGMIWYAPTVNSYRRTLEPGFAGWGRTWGFDNRTTSCRVAGDSRESLRIELRVPGADVNPYLALAAALASARAGVVSGTDPGPPVRGNAYELDPGPTPRDLREAAERFEASAWAREAFGDHVIRHYAAAARFEADQFARAVTDWELERYFELA